MGRITMGHIPHIYSCYIFCNTHTSWIYRHLRGDNHRPTRFGHYSIFFHFHIDIHPKTKKMASITLTVKGKRFCAHNIIPPLIYILDNLDDSNLIASAKKNTRIEAAHMAEFSPPRRSRSRHWPPQS